jgi:hypothetical protein
MDFSFSFALFTLFSLQSLRNLLRGKKRGIISLKRTQIPYKEFVFVYCLAEDLGLRDLFVYFSEKKWIVYQIGEKKRKESRRG